MSKLLNELAEMHNLTVRGTQAWGTVDGYWFQIALPTYNTKVLQIHTAVQYSAESTESVLSAALATLVRENPAVIFNHIGGTVTLGRKAGFGGYKAQEIEALLLKATSAFRGAGLAPACSKCCANAADSFAMVNGTALKLCSKCQSEIENSIVQQAAEHAEVKNNYLRGTLGAFLGALVGSVAWVVIGLLGYVAAIGGIAISFCAAKGYTLMKGKLTKPAILIICIISIFVMITAEFVSYDIAVYKEVVKSVGDVSFTMVTQVTYDSILHDSEVSAEFIKNCLLGLLFLALGSYVIIKPLFAKAKAPGGTFERL
jgi:hypothetical protein